MGKTKKIRSDIVRDSINTFGTNVIRALLGLIASFVVLRRVDPFIKGLYNQVQVWGGGLNTILGLSVTSAVIYFVARYTIKNAKAAVWKLTAVITLMIVAVGAGLLFALRHSSFFQKTPVSFLFAIVIYGVLSLLLNICLMVLRGENKFKSYNVINLTQQVLVTALAFFIFFRPNAAVWVWATNGICAAMIAFAVYCILRWSGPKPVPAPENDMPVRPGTMVSYSLKSHVSNVMTYLNQNLGNYLVQGRYELSIFAVYNFAFTMMQQVWILPDAVSQVVMSRIAAMQEQKDKVRLTLLSSKIVTYVTTVTAVLLYIMAYLFVPILFPMYKGAVAPLGYLIVGSVFISYVKVLNNSISAYGRPELNIIPTALGIAANIVFSLLLVPMGLNGIALATSISMTVQGLTSVAIFCRFSHTPVSRLVIPSREEIASVKGILKK